MNLDRIRAEFRRELRNLRRAGETLERLPDVTRRSYLGGAVHDVAAFDLDERSADRVIREQIEHFRGIGRGFEWKVFSFDSPPDLRERLRRAGFSVGEREAVVVYDLAEGMGAFAETGTDVRRVTRVEDLGDFRRVAEEVFEKDYSLTVGELADALRSGRPGHDAYVAYVDGVPASVGRLYTDPASKFAGFYGGGTRAEFRGRGLYRAVITARARDAAALGARYLQVDARPTSLPILLRLGFERLADTWPCEFEERTFFSEEVSQA
ncbi:MAG: GNAT family N-acetyltransferase [Fimbriimonas sp.]